MIQPYDVILADPPWSYRDKNTGGSMTSGSQTKYKTMALEEITAMAPLIDRAMAPDSTLFLWGTVPMLPEALYVLGERGYDYKTKIEWIKGELGDDGQIKGRLGLGLGGVVHLAVVAIGVGAWVAEDLGLLDAVLGILDSIQLGSELIGAAFVVLVMDAALLDAGAGHI